MTDRFTHRSIHKTICGSWALQSFWRKELEGKNSRVRGGSSCGRERSSESVGRSTLGVCFTFQSTNQIVRGSSCRFSHATGAGESNTNAARKWRLGVFVWPFRRHIAVLTQPAVSLMKAQRNGNRCMMKALVNQQQSLRNLWNYFKLTVLKSYFKTQRES